MNNSINPFKNTSEGFRQNNKVYHQSEILKMDIPIKGQVDSIDLNNNGIIETKTENCGFFRPHTFWQTTTEPSLMENYDSIKTFATENEIEVLTQDALMELSSKSDINIANYEVKGNRLYTISYDSVKPKNQSTLNDLAKIMAPFAKAPKWAIDIKHNQFMVYEPKQ